MLGLRVCLGNECTSRFELAGTQVQIGSDDHNDLVLRDGNVRPFHCTLSCEAGAWSVSFAPEIYINGQLVAAPCVLADHDRLQLGHYSVVLELSLRGAGVPGDLVERDLIDAIVAGDDASRIVYADWLEQYGDRFRSEFLRLEHTVFADGTNARARDPDLRRRLRELASHIDIVWRQKVGRPLIDGCIPLADECPGEWGRLAATDDPRVRRCASCASNIYYCRSTAEAAAHTRDGRRTAVDARDHWTVIGPRP